MKLSRMSGCANEIDLCERRKKRKMEKKLNSVWKVEWTFLMVYIATRRPFSARIKLKFAPFIFHCDYFQVHLTQLILFGKFFVMSKCLWWRWWTMGVCVCAVAFLVCGRRRSRCQVNGEMLFGTNFSVCVCHFPWSFRIENDTESEKNELCCNDVGRWKSQWIFNTTPTSEPNVVHRYASHYFITTLIR